MLPVTSSSAPRLCTQCKSPADKKCGRCFANYCSAECQTKHWPVHKNVCGKIVPFPSEKKVEAAAKKALPPLETNRTKELKKYIAAIRKCIAPVVQERDESKIESALKGIIAPIRNLLNFFKENFTRCLNQGGWEPLNKAFSILNIAVHDNIFRKKPKSTLIRPLENLITFLEEFLESQKE